MRFTDFVAASLTLGGLSAAAPTRYTNETESLYKAMEKRGRSFIGTALTIRNETIEETIIQQDFNSITPENAMKWESTEPSQANFTFDGADQIAAFATRNELQLHCHTLVWHSQLPAWVSQGGFDNATLIQVMEDHIAAVAGRYKDVCTRWDVVNEALNEDGTYRESVWYNTIGEAFLPIAFSLAAKYAPDTQLFYNDYNIDLNGAKTDGARRIVELIQSYGVRIDGVGYQAHFTQEATPTAPGPLPEQPDLIEALEKTASLGVEVAYTEIDIRMNTPATAEKLEVQAGIYERVAGACLAVESCIGMTVWGISDKYSWIPETFPGEGAANVWGESYEKKPAYTGFLAGINGEA
ncbi:unnamed protein product [Periconia digitata]|uniref:Beta-xylanase n=1 Tax=Periconia digitata TaxID=1303443 RepID=A0A9W4U5L6_9PLEO|nr:unnamed protein product [Periconia digitata]